MPKPVELYIVNTDYPLDIMVSRSTDGRFDFLNWLIEALPLEIAGSRPVVSVGYLRRREVWGYFPYGFASLHEFLLEQFANGSGEKEKAEFLDSILRGTNEVLLEAMPALKPAGFLINSAGQHFDGVFGILEREYKYKFNRVAIESEKS